MDETSSLKMTPWTLADWSGYGLFIYLLSYESFLAPEKKEEGKKKMARVILPYLMIQSTTHVTSRWLDPLFNILLMVAVLKITI